MNRETRDAKCIENFRVPYSIFYSFFTIDKTVLREKAPGFYTRIFVILVVICCLSSFIYFVDYFSSEKISETIVSNVLLSSDYDCQILSPLIGVYHNRGLGSVNSSENGQFSGSFMRQEECMNVLRATKPCEHTYDYLSVIGVPML